MAHARPVRTSTEESSSSDRRCCNCGAFVSRDFARVFGNNDDEVFGCLDCMNATEVKNGDARHP